jgi:hypothetical protein
LVLVFSFGGDVKTFSGLVQKRLIINLLLLLAVSILAIVFIQNDNKTEKTAKVDLVSAIDSNNIHYISIQRDSTPDIIFQRVENDWFITSPFKARAKKSRIKSILQILKSRSFTQILIDNTLLTPYQLDPPLITLRLDSHEFSFGTTEPLNDKRYLKFKNVIHLLNDSLFHQLRQSPMFFVSTKLIPEQESINSIKYNHYIITQVNNTWSISPKNSNLNKNQIRTLIDTWQMTEARHVQNYKTEEAKGQVTLKYESGNIAKFDVISTFPELVLARTDLSLQYHLNKDMVEQLLVDQIDLNPPQN